ncbi:hypothetical protein ACMD2_05548 [Ananas comosus]|uniref:Uncharacterized protein n=1 Tax=Ananas comosus TaxID=4615 RepID=A0A199VI76_ANACO|nr:hypothetical protein ACMD2_05548 [Ananas comosus]
MSAKRPNTSCTAVHSSSISPLPPPPSSSSSFLNRPHTLHSNTFDSVPSADGGRGANVPPQFSLSQRNLTKK